MTQFLIRCFIKHPDDVKNAAVRTAYGNLASLVGVACNLLLCLGICGELGADTALTETFLRMGVDELSMNAKSILPVRKIVRSLDLSKPSVKHV